jgi:hypothetical protein
VTNKLRYSDYDHKLITSRKIPNKNTIEEKLQQHSSSEHGHSRDKLSSEMTNMDLSDAGTGKNSSFCVVIVQFTYKNAHEETQVLKYIQSTKKLKISSGILLSILQ